MTSLKTGYLLFLAVFLFLSIVPTVTEVVNSVANCTEFLLQNKPPQIPGILEGGNIQGQNRYKPICQTYNNQRRFLTLYDTTNKIPVFSAYKYIEIKDTGRPPNQWRIEPQLEGKTDKNMENDKGQPCNNQASSADYSNTEGYDRGHLYPSTHGSTKEDKNSTMTLTNIVPQADRFNQKRWSKMEECIDCVMKTFCKDNNNNIEGFVVTGAQPGPKKLKNKVNIPSTVWSAFCCYHSRRKMWIASAHWDNNVKEGPEYLQSQTLRNLYSKLGGANLFPETQCPLNKTLGDYLKDSPNHSITKLCSKCKSPLQLTSPQPPTNSHQCLIHSQQQLGLFLSLALSLQLAHY